MSTTPPADIIRFLSCMSIKPTITSDEIFDSSSEGDVLCNSDNDHSGDDNDNEDINTTTTDTGNTSTCNEHQRKAESWCYSSKKKPSSTAKSKKKNHNNSEPAGNELESSLSHIIRATLKLTEEIDKQHKSSGAKIAALAMNFKQTVDALGGRVQVALAFDRFKMFLTVDEKRELQELQHEHDSDEEL